LFSNPTLYCSVVGALHATLTRPKISYAVNIVCQFMTKPLESHWIIMKHILRYLKGIIIPGLHFQPASLNCSLSLKAYGDVDWATNIDDRRSTLGAAIFWS